MNQIQQIIVNSERVVIYHFNDTDHLIVADFSNRAKPWFNRFLPEEEKKHTVSCGGMRVYVCFLEKARSFGIDDLIDRANHYYVEDSG